MKTKGGLGSWAAAAALLGALLLSPARGAVVLPTVIGSNMVVQSGEPLQIWGWAEAGEKVTIRQGGAVVATAVGEGKDRKSKPWRAELPAQEPGPVTDIAISGSNVITITNVLAGDVWLCSGQSNMVMTVKKGPWCSYGGVPNADQEVAAATDSEIRFYRGGGGNNAPLPGSKSGWEVCTPENAPHFSAVGYFFARKLRSELKTPVGIMPLAAGGRPAEWFIPERMMAGDADFQAQKIKAKAVRDELGAKAAADKKAWADFKKQADDAKRKGEKPPPRPVYQLTAEEAARFGECGLILDFGFIYERDIHPLAPFPIKGCVWYQGEANAKQGDQYAPLLIKLIESWREDWGKPLPFLVVALAGWGKPEPWTSGNQGGSFPLVREAGIRVAEALPQVGVISAVDVGESANIHPLNKKPVGERAALWALNHVYGRPVVSDGPKFGKVDFSSGKAIVAFAANSDGLMLKSPGGFELAGADRKFFTATAVLQGETLEVTALEVAKPVALRYAFLNFPECTVYNEAGLPALPFRTDDWPVKPVAP